MNSQDRRREKALRRRHDHLTDRLEKWDRGDPAYTRAERAAIWWALCVIAGADEEGIIPELVYRGEEILRKEKNESEDA